MEDNSILEQLRRRLGKLHIKNLRFLIISHEADFVNPVGYQKVEGSNGIQKRHTRRVGKAHKNEGVDLSKLLSNSYLTPCIEVIKLKLPQLLGIR